MAHQLDSRILAHGNLFRTGQELFIRGEPLGGDDTRIQTFQICRPAGATHAAKGQGHVIPHVPDLPDSVFLCQSDHYRQKERSVVYMVVAVDMGDPYPGIQHLDHLRLKLLENSLADILGYVS